MQPIWFSSSDIIKEQKAHHEHLPFLLNDLFYTTLEFLHQLFHLYLLTFWSNSQKNYLSLNKSTGNCRLFSLSVNLVVKDLS